MVGKAASGRLEGLEVADDAAPAAPPLAAASPDMTSPVSRAFHVLDIVAAAGPSRFADVQRLSPLPKATLSRLLHQLVDEGMLVFDVASQRYRLGLRLIRLAHGAWESATLVDAARPVLDQLAASLGTTIHLACLEGGQVLYLDKRVPRPTIRMFSSPGRVGPAYCTGVGKAMLAFLEPAARDAAIDRQSFHPHTPRTITTPMALRSELDRIRAAGHAVDDEEHEANVICVAVPILSAGGMVIGAVSATGTTHMTSLEALSRHLAGLKAAATAIARAAEIEMLAR